MKEKKLREISTCAACNKPFGHTNTPFFYRITVEHYGVDIEAVKRQDGLAAVMESPILAAVMGPDQDMANRIVEPITITICHSCYLLKQIVLAELIEGARE